MPKAEKLVNNLLIVLGVLLAGEGIFSFVAGMHIPLWELLVQLFLSGAVIIIGVKRTIEL